MQVGDFVVLTKEESLILGFVHEEEEYILGWVLSYTNGYIQVLTCSNEEDEWNKYAIETHKVCNPSKITVIHHSDMLEDAIAILDDQENILSEYKED